MIRKAFSIIILVSMMLHCASRLGLLSYLYSNRSEIASSLGFSSDDSIAVCDSNYFQGQTLIIEHEDSGHKFPPLLIQTQEINLFFISIAEIPFSEKIVLNMTCHSPYLSSRYLSALPSVFHPPAIA